MFEFVCVWICVVTTVPDICPMSDNNERLHILYTHTTHTFAHAKIHNRIGISFKFLGVFFFKTPADSLEYYCLVTINVQRIHVLTKYAIINSFLHRLVRRSGDWSISILVLGRPKTNSHLRFMCDVNCIRYYNSKHCKSVCFRHMIFYTIYRA